MKTFSPESQDVALLAAVAVALVNTPRAPLHELARAVGVCKSTVYRASHTRDELVATLMRITVRELQDAYTLAGLRSAPVGEALSKLTQTFVDDPVLSAFVTFFWNNADAAAELGDRLLPPVDDFFLRGQQEGVFRVDISAIAMTEVWFSTVTTYCDAARRGRVARANLGRMVVNVLLNGCAAPSAIALRQGPDSLAM